MHQLLRSKRRVLATAATVALVPAFTLGTSTSAHAAPAPDIKVTQNASEAITSLNSVACGNASNTAENHYYRRFDLAGAHGAADGFSVKQVVFGIETATSGDGTIPGNVSIYSIDHSAAFTLANLTSVATTATNLDSAADGTLKTVDLAGTVPAGKDMVLEVEVDAATTGKLFFIGSNTGNETGASYLRASACAIAQPSTTASIGFPNMHIVLYANGKAVDCTNAETAVTTATNAVTAATAAKTKAQAAIAPADAAVASATAADTAAKKAVAKAKAKLKKAKKSGNAAKIKKAKKSLKSAKAKAKSAAAALTAAQAAKTAADAALAKATSDLTTANTALTAANAKATTECAQPALPTRPAPSSGSGTASKPAPGFVTAR